MATYITNPSSEIRIPGSYQLTDVFLSTPLHDQELSIHSMLIEINIYESIFKGVLSGSIMLRDTSNLLSTYPICGYETIDLLFSCDNGEDTDWFHTVFRVYSVKNVVEITGGGKTYSLEFISAEYIMNQELVVDRSFSSMTTSDIVNTVWSDTLGLLDKPIKIEETRGLIDMISPFWHPIKLMDWLCSRSVSKDREGANYVFFETFDGFNFISLETLVADIDDSKISTFIYGTKDVQGDEKAATIVSEIQIDSSFDLIQNLSLGMYSSTMVEHDIVKRSVKSYKFDYEKSFDSYEHLEDWSFLHSDVDDFKEKYDSKRFLIPQHYQLFGGSKVGSKDTSIRERTLQSRVSQLQQINTYKITLKLPGNIRTRAGDVIYLYYPSKNIEHPEDPLLSGHYLVLNVRNTMSGMRHDTTIEIAKDSYFGEIPSQGV